MIKTGIFACMTALALLVPPPSTPSEPSLPVLARFPLIRQLTDYSCGAAVLRAIFHYYGARLSEGAIRRAVGTNDDYGSDIRRMTAFAVERGLPAELRLDMTIEALAAELHAKRPVILCLQAWRERAGSYASHWDDGHYVIAIGADARNFYFMDPWLDGAVGYIPRAELAERWHERWHTGELRYHTAIVFPGATPKPGRSRERPVRVTPIP